MILDVVNTFTYSALYCLYLGIFIFILFRWKFFDIKDISKKYLAGFFLLKVTAGICLTLIYTYYYTDTSKADIYRYFNDSKFITSLVFHEPQVWIKVISGIGMNEPETFRHLLPTQYFSHPENDFATNNTFIIRVISVLNFLSFNNIYINTLLLNFLSFAGLTVFYKSFSKYFAEFPLILCVPVYLLPSVVFWGNGLLKEQLIFTFLGFFFFTPRIFREKRLFLTLTFKLIIVSVIYHIKPSVALCLSASIIFLPDINISNARRITTVCCIAAAIMVFVFAIAPEWRDGLCWQIITKRNEFISLAMNEKARSYAADVLTSASCNQLFSLIPPAIIDAILRPFLWEDLSLFEFFSAIENTLFLTFITVQLFFIKIPKGKEIWLGLFCCSFALLNYLIIGLTVPIAGALVHYRTIAAPFLLLTFLLVTDKNRLKLFFTDLAWWKNKKK